MDRGCDQSSRKQCDLSTCQFAAKLGDQDEARGEIRATIRGRIEQPCRRRQDLATGLLTRRLAAVVDLMLARSATELPSGPGWAYEPKLDGWLN